MDILETTSAPPRVLVAMSGGVDSSVAALLLRRAGHEVIGVNMRTHRLTAEEVALGGKIKTCCSPTDARDARKCADSCEFPFYSIDVEPAFERDVIDPFIRAYLGGRTPNPCVLCNNHVKLGLLLEKATLYGCSRVATGHYARKERHPGTGRWTLMPPRDSRKDQSYYLYGLGQDQLERLLFPLADLTKDEVRALARENGLATADKPESQEICFIPDNDYRGFLRRRLAESGTAMPRGQFLALDGRQLGPHEGIGYYTVGQRRGLNLPGPEPLYVVAIDASSGNVIVGSRSDAQFDGLVADGLTWMGLEDLRGGLRARVQVRYRHAPAWARLERTGPDCLEIHFDQPQPAISPGQATVFYDDEGRVLGGGWIREAIRVSR